MAYNIYTGWNNPGGNDQNVVYNALKTDYDSGDFSSGNESSGSGSSSSQNWSGLPSWVNDPNNKWNIQNLWGAAFSSGGDAWRRGQQGGQVNPATAALIEKQRLQMPEQYRNQMDLFYQRSLNPMMNKLSSRGVLNSSITGDALAKSLRDVSARYGDEATKSNVWASNELLKNMGTNQQMNYDTWKSIMSMMPQLLAAMRESTGTQQSEWQNEGSGWGVPWIPGMND